MEALHKHLAPHALSKPGWRAVPRADDAQLGAASALLAAQEEIALDARDTHRASGANIVQGKHSGADLVQKKHSGADLMQREPSGADQDGAPTAQEVQAQQRKEVCMVLLRYMMGAVAVAGVFVAVGGLAMRVIVGMAPQARNKDDIDESDAEEVVEPIIKIRTEPPPCPPQRMDRQSIASHVTSHVSTQNSSTMSPQPSCASDRMDVKSSVTSSRGLMPHGRWQQDGRS